MKKLLTPAILMLLVLSAVAQMDSRKDSDKDSEKNFHLGFGIGFGSMVQEPKILNATFDIQSEFKPVSAFSLFSSLGYSRLFAAGESGSAGYATLMAGPCGYISPKFFVGAGGGIALFTASGYSSTVFAYNPHLGFNAKATQITLGYNGISDAGFVQLRALFNINGKK
jgi:hypothetical protein